MSLAPIRASSRAQRRTHSLWAPWAWVGGRWQRDVVLRCNDQGLWTDVQCGVSASAALTQDATTQVLSGPALPGMVNAHSHAFQRSFAGLAERREAAQDDFWSWRDRMYQTALRISAEQLTLVARQLYAEMLVGGYTHVCEFHYLHHQPDGRPYPERTRMARALAQAAQEVGIGLTLLPVLYERGGFQQPTLRADQRRFATHAEDVAALRQDIRGWQLPSVEAGAAIHSLRAASAASIERLCELSAGDPGPLHIHVAEQTAEVNDCMAATGMRPVAWLAQHVPLNARWHLVHATHTEPAELEAVARSGAGVVLCPTTEANLGDGLPDVLGWLSHDTPISIGSDSHVCRVWPHEIKLLEYGQRLIQRQRNVLAAPHQGQPSTAARLFEAAQRGGAAAAAWTHHGLTPGARADLLVMDLLAPGLAGVPANALLDALVFVTDAPAFSQVWVASQQVVNHGRHVRHDEISQDFLQVMQTLHAH